MKECRKVRKLLSRYLDKETSNADSAIVEMHIHKCSYCKKELLELSQIKELVLGRERKALSEEYFLRQLRKKIVHEQHTEKKVSLIDLAELSRRLIPVPVAMIVISIVFLFLISTKQNIDNSSLMDSILSGTPVTTDAALGLILGGQE